MAIATVDTAQISRRKHQRSSDDGLEEASKRKKHRHHHRSGDPPLLGPNLRSDYDMEEGEIVEQEEGYLVEVCDKSDVQIQGHASSLPQEDLRRENARDLKGCGEDRCDDMERWDRGHSLEILDRDREEREMNRDKRREKGRDRSEDRDLRWDKERHRSRDREFKMDWRREKELYRSREKEVGRDSRRERERDRSRDRDSCRERERDRSRDRDSCRERERDRSRDSDRGRERERNQEKDRGGDGTENNRYTDSWHPRNDAPGYHRDRTRKNNSEKHDSSKNGSLARVEDELKRDEDEEEDYQERVSLQLVEQEEEDLNRIKEESRRRRQAILEKYKTQQLQQQVKSSSGDVEKDKSCGQLLTSANSHPDNSDDNNDRTETSFSVEKSPSHDVIPALETTCDDRSKSEKPKDMFHDDIFGESPAVVCKSVKGNVLPIKRCGLQDNLDDADGYYTYMHGEILGEKQGGKFDGRYQVTAAHGKGVFSTVVRANDLKASNGEPKEVAIKIIRNNEIMFKAGQSELVILSKLVGADPEDKRHCIRLFSSFEYRKHLCLVFESLDMNLREVIKKYGSIGLNLAGVKALAKQLFIALKHLQNCGVLHCDIKPDNILVNERRSVLKLCDFGNAMFAGKNDLTPYLVSRFYRAPEIILGLPYDHALDMWSVGCCLYELYTGEVVFKGATNNDMLRLYMELKGPFPKKMLRKGLFVDQHFDKDFNFIAMEVDPVTKKVIKRRIDNVKRNDIGKMVTGSSGDDPKMVADFKNLLGKMFVLDPEKRLAVSQALNHPFITRTSEQ